MKGLDYSMCKQSNLPHSYSLLNFLTSYHTILYHRVAYYILPYLCPEVIGKSVGVMFGIRLGADDQGRQL